VSESAPRLGEAGRVDRRLACTAGATPNLRLV